MSKYYAVRVGREPGIYESWSQVKPLVSGYPGAQHKSFKSRSDAEAYLVAGPTTTVGRKRNRDDDYDNDIHNFKDNDQSWREPPARARRTESVPDRFYPMPTAGVLIVGSLNSVPSRSATISANNHAGSHSSGRNPYDVVISGPVQRIQPGYLYELEFDGAARGNPGRAGCGAALRYNGNVVCRLRKYMGKCSTNNEAEYTALIEGLRMAKSVGVTRVHAKGDSKLVVCQVSGQWKINKEHLQRLCDKVHSEKRNLQEFQISHIPREWNTEADKLSNDAIDLAYQN